jgi:hypothetical protein
MVLLAGKHICQYDKRREGKKLGIAVPYLVCAVCVGLHRAAGLLRFPCCIYGDYALLSEL